MSPKTQILIRQTLEQFSAWLTIISHETVLMPKTLLTSDALLSPGWGLLVGSWETFW